MNASSPACTANLNRLEIKQIVINAEVRPAPLKNVGVGTKCLHAMT